MKIKAGCILPILQKHSGQEQHLNCSFHENAYRFNRNSNNQISQEKLLTLILPREKKNFDDFENRFSINVDDNLRVCVDRNE